MHPLFPCVETKRLCFSIAVSGTNSFSVKKILGKLFVFHRFLE